MLKKQAFFLPQALILTVLAAGGAIAQRTPEPAKPSTPREPLATTFSLLVDGGGFLGVNAEDVNSENMARYGLREPRGVGITEVVKDSPAEKAGLRKDDVILRVDNDAVSSVRKLTRLISEIAPDHAAKLTISRGGAQQEVSVTIGKRNIDFMAPHIGGVLKGEPRAWKWEYPGSDGDALLFSLGSYRRIGVSTMPLTKQLADYFGIAEGKGVLVTSVSEDSPAARAGVQAGDVITAVEGEKVESVGDVSRAINKKKEGDVSLTIVRNKSQRNITVSPTKTSLSDLEPGRQVGRRIVIPRIELPVIPEMNISLPRIEIPSIPAIDIQLPTISPRVIRVGSRTTRPI